MFHMKFCCDNMKNHKSLNLCSIPRSLATSNGSPCAFTARDDGKGDVFVHQMNIVKSRMKKVYFRSLAPDEKVEFDVVQGKAGPEAANVTGLDGADVQGRVFLYVLNHRSPDSGRT